MSSSKLLDIKKLLNTRPSLFSMSLSQNNGDLALKLTYIDLGEGFDVKSSLKILSGYSLIKKNEDTGHYAMQSTTTIFQR